MNARNFCHTGVVFGCLLNGALLCAQQPGAIEREQGVYTLHEQTHMALLDVTVADKQGHPVTGLTKDDFKVLEDGQPQTIQFFEEHVPIDPAEIAKEKAAALAGQPLNTFTNYEPFTGRPVTVLLLNELFSETMNGNDSDPHQQMLRLIRDGKVSPQMKQRFETFLDPLHQRMIETVQNAPPDTPFAIYLLDSEVRLVQPVTTDRVLLLAAIDQMFKGPHFGSEELINPKGYAASLLAPPKSDTGYPAADIPVRRGILKDAMQQLATSLKHEPGRKNLFFFTGPFQCSVVGSPHCSKTPFPNDSMDYLCGLMDTLEQGRMSIYPHYPEGQVGYGFGCPSLADLGTSAHYYTLYYTPTNRDWDGKYRATTVETTDKKGLHLVYRKGYYGTPENAEAHYYTANGRASAPVAPASDGSTITATVFHTGNVGSENPGTDAAEEAVNPEVVFNVRVIPADTIVVPGSATSVADREKQEYRQLTLQFTMPAREFKVMPSGAGQYSVRLEIGAVPYADSKALETYESQVAANFNHADDPGIATSVITAKLTLNVPEHGLNRLVKVSVRDMATGQSRSMVISMEQVMMPRVQ